MTRGATTSACLLICLGLVPAVPGAQSLDPPYLREMPSIERVLADTRGTDATDTLARQAAAVQQLQEIVEVMAGERATRMRLTADEERLMNGYAAEFARLDRQAETRFGRATDGLKGWRSARQTYRNDATFADALVNRYFSADCQRRWREASAAARAHAAEHPVSPARRTSDSGGLGAIAALSAALLAIGLWRESRPFGLDATDPHVLRLGFGRQRIDWLTGTVTGFREYRMERVTYHTVNVERATGRKVIDSDLPTETKTVSTSLLDMTSDFTIEHPGGRYEIKDSNASRVPFLAYNPDGHLWSVAWLVPRWASKEATRLLFANHTHKTSMPLWHTIEPLLSPSAWPTLPAAALGFVAGTSTDALGRLIGSSSPVLSGLALMLLGGAAVVLRNRHLAKSRLRRFEQTDLPRLMAAMKP